MKIFSGIRGCNYMALAAIMSLCALTSFAAEQEISRSKVFYAADPTSLSLGRTVNPRVAKRMVDSLVVAATGQPDVARAWKSLAGSKERVGIKISASGGAVSGTHPEIVDAIIEGLHEAGIPSSNIIVWDRNMQDLAAAGYRKDTTRYQLRSVDPKNGYDTKALVSAPVLGKLIWGDSGFGNKTEDRFAKMGGDQLSNRSYFSKILSTEVTKIINVPSLADSFLTGINGALANMVIPNIDNWRRFTKAPSYGDPYLAEIYSDPVIRDKVVLTVMDGLVLQYAGGPGPNPEFLLDHFTIYASKDPVAIDAIATRLIDEARKPSKLPPLGPMTGWLQAAESLELGTKTPEKIDLIPSGLGSVR